MYHSQEKQDLVLDTHVFQGYKRGVFVEVGAWDGVCFSNTLFFEKERDWTGLTIEPHPEKYEELKKNRPSTIHLNVAVNDVNEVVDFLTITGDTSMLSGIKAHYDPRHLQRIENETKQLNTTYTTIPIQSKRLDTIFTEHNVQRVHYLSIDVEGSEFNVIRSIDFSNVFIDVIEFENNYPDKSDSIVEYLRTKGYEKAPIQSIDIFMIHTRSPFYVKKPLSFLSFS
jgi:FkbM family methyltransferase